LRGRERAEKLRNEATKSEKQNGIFENLPSPVLRSNLESRGQHASTSDSEATLKLFLIIRIDWYDASALPAFDGPLWKPWICCLQLELWGWISRRFLGWDRGLVLEFLSLHSQRESSLVLHSKTLSTCTQIHVGCTRTLPGAHHEVNTR